MAKYRFDLAQASDDADLRAVLAATPMPGTVSVSFQREPSYFGAAVVEGRFRQVLVARGESAGRCPTVVVAFGALSVSDRYVNGRPRPIGYLSNLRVLPGHRRGSLVGRGYALLRKLHEDRRTSLYLTTIAQDNQTALRGPDQLAGPACRNTTRPDAITPQPSGLRVDETSKQKGGHRNPPGTKQRRACDPGLPACGWSAAAVLPLL